MSDREKKVKAVQSFYSSVQDAKTLEMEDFQEHINQFVDANWVSTPNAHPEGKIGYPALSELLKGFVTIIPDLQWDIEQTWVDGDTVICKCKATGTPKGNFLGVETDGTKSFDIMSIDVHKVNDEGKMIESYHVEEWLKAVQQISPN